MKFGSLQRNRQKIFKVRSFKSGTVTSSLAADIPDNALFESENMQYEGGILCTRAGISATSRNIIKSENPPFYDTYSYKVTDFGVNINGNYKKIAIEEYCQDDSIYYCNIFFVGTDGRSSAAGNLTFNRITIDDFYQPTNILFYSASPVEGAGVFALVSTRNIYNYSQTSHMVYELETDLSSWKQLYNFYVPVVYMNGRGNRYEESRSLGFAYTGTPMFLESRNMLTERFKAYFTSDGYSSSFRLPFTNLNNDIVKCRVYMSSTEYVDWLIMDSQSSVTSAFGNVQVTLTVNREKGMLSFTCASGDYSVPLTNKYHENNICVTAGKALENGIESAVSSTCCTVLGSRLIFSGGTDRGRLISVRTDRPLYFPCDSSYKIGGEEGINALLSYKSGILAFKNNEIYSLTLKNGNAINSSSLLADDDSVFYTKDTFTAKKISGDKGLENKHSCLLCGDKAIWLGSDRAVYKLSTSSFEITKLSANIERYLNSLSLSEVNNAFAVHIDNRYLLLLGKKAVIMDYRDGGFGNPAWYLWSFPNNNLLGGFSSSGKLYIFCKGTDGRVFYTAEFSGTEDTDICRSGDETVINKYSVAGRAVTKSFDFGSMVNSKLIDSISVSASSKERLEIYINDRHFDALGLGEPDIDYTCETLKSVKLIPHLSPVKSLRLKFSSDSAFSLGELIINYRETV